ncbi:hypothetical protein KB236_07890 [Levilactobacillus brevis]|uniref:Uncharacterized protein n=1 Tax=Levilactobacillus hammesii TaxID=267633 RepID=A0A921F0C4_9LACO|nr:hypothetical protein KB236_07890 [Levilactobacillus brevis]HJE86324.1 hypothetical protein [Levilactobacillus hammesii]
MSLTTAKNYLLLTERINEKPVLRTRFTTQAYLVLATLLDLIDQHVLTAADGQMRVADAAKFDALPQYLNELKVRLQTDLRQDTRVKTLLKVVTSWNIVNAIYDGIGAELEAAGLVERVIFQNNLKPHVIYEPQDASRQRVRTNLAQRVTAGTVTPTDSNLWLILRQQNALKYLFSDQQLSTLTTAFAQQAQHSPAVTTTQDLVVTAGEIIQMKKFEMDGWLS